MNYFVLDIGGTFIKYALMDKFGVIQWQKKVPTPLTSLEDFFAVVDTIMISDCDGIAISFPGPVESTSGEVIEGGSLKYMSGLPLTKLMEERYHVPCTIENDARCAALAEVWQGNLKDIRIGLVLVFGTGIGSSLTIDGTLFKGAHAFAGEISCMITRNMEELGWKASFSYEAGVPFLLEKVKQAKGIQNAFDGKQLFHLLDEEDDITTAIFKKYCADLAKQLYNIQCMMDPQRICIGGGISQQSRFLTTLQEALDTFYEQIPVNAPKPEIMPCRFFNDSNLIGALYHYQKQIG